MTILSPSTALLMAVARLQGFNWVQLVPVPVVLTKRLPCMVRDRYGAAKVGDTIVRMRAATKKRLAIHDWLLWASIVPSLRARSFDGAASRCLLIIA
jgi:hypothetical protein